MDRRGYSLCTPFRVFYRRAILGKLFGPVEYCCQNIFGNIFYTVSHFINGRDSVLRFFI